ncbi:hypothetical protein DPMN_163552 [Dreissena polymorpha]|uniref:Uncharacterized protein n=1 Tax=Dreissena polymorpha TaxID=45954 RepID=A0A9D4EWZ7_DREPO|nr:hypothetical protein DPMN_163552 [Dreissena polymorpha]
MSIPPCYKVPSAPVQYLHKYAPCYKVPSAPVEYLNEYTPCNNVPSAPVEYLHEYPPVTKSHLHLKSTCISIPLLQSPICTCTVPA